MMAEEEEEENDDDGDVHGNSGVVESHLVKKTIQKMNIMLKLLSFYSHTILITCFIGR